MPLWVMLIIQNIYITSLSALMRWIVLCLRGAVFTKSFPFYVIDFIAGDFYAAFFTIRHVNYLLIDIVFIFIIRGSGAKIYKILSSSYNYFIHQEILTLRC